MKPVENNTKFLKTTGPSHIIWNQLEIVKFVGSAVIIVSYLK